MKYLFYTFLVYGNYYMEIKRLNDSKPANYGFIILIIAKSTANDNIQDVCQSILLKLRKHFCTIRM